MRFRIFIFFIVLSQFSFSQSTLTKEQINRLADAGKVWGYLKFYHPYLQYKDINWDSAFTDAVPLILKASSKKEYEGAIQLMFGVFNDPVTSVLQTPGTKDEIKPSTVVVNDSLMIITHFDDRVIDIEENGSNTISKINRYLKSIKAVIFDLRADKDKYLLNDGPTILQTPFAETQMLSNLFSGSITLPAIRTNSVTTLISETSDNNSNYQSPFLIEKRNRLFGRANRDIPLIFIINHYSSLPLEAVGLQLAGKAIIIQEEGSGEIGIVPDVKFMITDSIIIRARLGEIIHAKYGLGFKPDFLVPVSTERELAINKAKEILKTVGQSGRNSESDCRGTSNEGYPKSLTKKPYPSIGERALSVAKIYSILKYFYPNKQIWEHSLDSIYLEFLPRFLSAKDSVDYLKAVVEMYTYSRDGHGFIQQYGRPVSFRNATNTFAPFHIKIIEGQMVIYEILNDSVCNAIGIKIGDIILEKNGKPAMQEFNETRKYFSASNYESQTNLMSLRYLRNQPGVKVKFKILNAEKKTRIVEIMYTPHSTKEMQKITEYFNKGNFSPVFHFPAKDIGYVNLGAITNNEIDSMLNLFRNTKGIIFDDRTYPRSGAVYLMANRLGLTLGGGSKNLPGKDLDYFRDNKIRGWIYKGKTVCLINENAQSAAETAAGILYKSTLIGNHTAGANGGVVNFFIPGDIRLSFTGSAVKGQGAGIQPHILVTPTIKGIQQGKDEILERAIKFLETGK